MNIPQQVVPWAAAFVGGAAASWLAYKLAPKKYRAFLGGLGLLGGGALSYFLADKYLVPATSPTPATAGQSSAPAAEHIQQATEQPPEQQPQLQPREQEQLTEQDQSTEVVPEQTPAATNPQQVSWFPKFIRADYNIFGLFLALGFYYSYKVASMLGKKNAEAIGMSLEEYRESTIYRRSVNILMMLTLMVTVLVFWGISFIGMNPDTGFRPLDIYSMSYESYCLIVLPFLYFYNGERGYDSKWFRIFNYLYFPVHMVFIFAVFALIFGL